MIGFQLRQVIGFECRLCHRLIDDDERKRTMVSAWMFGFVAYSICPSCFQEPEDMHDRNYRARVRRYCARPYRIPTPLESFTTPGGRTFKIRDGMHQPPRFKGDTISPGTRWPIVYDGEEAGALYFDLLYDREKPSFHASPNKLRWHFSADAPTGIGFDTSKHETLESVLASFAHSADEILDWHEGKRVESMFIHPTGWAQKGVP